MARNSSRSVAAGAAASLRIRSAATPSAASCCRRFGRVSMNIRSNSPGGSVNSREVSDARSSSGASTNCNCAISTPGGTSLTKRSSAISTPGGASMSLAAGGSSSGFRSCGASAKSIASDSRISSARVSRSSDDSPLLKPVASSARRDKALNTSPHRPQRTCPPAARSASADKRNTVSHFEHCVNTLS